MPFNPDIYRAYDIRGIVPDDFDATEAYHLGRAYAAFTKFERVVVARDMRPTGDELEPAVIEGLLDGGLDVLRIGLATSPMFYYAVHQLKADGGLMVTASHNPGKYNGAKMTREEAIPISGETGIMEIRDLVERREWPAVTKRGQISDHDVRDEYVAMVTQGGSAAGLKIVIDAGNGMTGYILAQVMKQLGGEVIPLYWDLDGSFPNHEADPLKEENNADVQAAVRKHGADLGIAFDGDGDRVFFFTEQGVTIPGDITTALIGREVLKEHPGTPIIFDIRSSRTTAEVIAEAGGRPLMWKVGHSLIKPKMREEGAWFAGEVSGHFYFAPWYAESSMLAMNYFLRLVLESGKPVSEIVAPLLRRAKTPEINFEVSDKEAVIQRLREHYKEADTIYDYDGIRFEYPTWWASVRPSNTEPKLRLNIEADTPELLKEKQQEIEDLIR
ncbi:phosphomannomutase/phosphoglucomutase [Patescibacteria group bacterium]|nr:phosphomannomutase/phosphoglucomutase [Patescibacteria group bacterium]